MADNNDLKINEEKKAKEPASQTIDGRVKYIFLAAIVIVVAIVITVVVKTANQDNNKDNKTAAVTQPQATEQLVTPTFMYFVSKQDEGYNDYIAAVDELKKQYDGKINFDVRDVEEHPEDKDNFPIENTPVLIMLNIHNDIIAIDSVTDKDKMNDYITSALGE